MAAGLALAACAGDEPPSPGPEADPVAEPDVTPEQAASPLYRAHQAWLTQEQFRAATAPGETLSEYAAKCDIATGIHVPAFNCDLGTEVPNQGSGSGKCDYPNVLNGACDPGSKFQVLVQTADAAAVGHCRKVGLPVAGSLYNDIAVIQYNKRNGAVCFYQALDNLPGNNVTAPIAGVTSFPWASPKATEAMHCTGCHDNGGFVRSKYLAQLTTPPNVLPSTSAGFDNLNHPMRYVGDAFAASRSWSVTTANASNDSGAACSTCHRIAVNNVSRFLGTAGRFAMIATAPTQASKNPHSPASPIWMRPGQVFYDPGAAATATRFRDCSNGFWSGQPTGFTTGTPTAGCGFAPLGMPWTGLSPAQVHAVVTM